MGKAAKAHRAKVAKRNAKLAQQKSGMQKAFERLIEEQMTKLREEQELNAKLGEQELNFEVVDEKVVDHAFTFTPNEEESAKINKEFEEDLQVEDKISELEK